MKQITCILVLFIAFSVHAQVESLAGHLYFRDQIQKPGFKKEDVCLSLQKDTTRISFRDQLRKHFMDQYLFEIHEENVNLYLSPVINFQAGTNWLGVDSPTLYPVSYTHLTLPTKA